MQRAKKAEEQYSWPSNLQDVNDIFTLMKQRRIFVDLLSNSEVCDMTAAQFSREDIIKYTGVNEGIEIGIGRGVNQGKTDDILEQLKDLGEVSED